MTVLAHAKTNPDAGQRASELRFAQQQIDYALGSSGRSFVVGWGYNPPLRAHHAGASCPDMPAQCDWQQFSSPEPNPQILFGALVSGPGGVLMNPEDPDDSYYDLRTDFLTNEVTVSYNAGFTSALAGLYQLL